METKQDLALVPIPNTEGLYFATENGDIYSIARGKLKKLKFEKVGGYYRLKINRERILVHRLIAYTFIGYPKDSSQIINHKNGNKSDNGVENLEWVSHGENISHSYRELGRTLPNRKLTNEQVKEIRQKSNLGVTNNILALEYSVNHCTISEVISKKRYKHI